MLYGFGKTVTYWLTRLLFRMRYEGLEHIPPHSGFILASNHRGYFDPVFIASKLVQPVHFMAKAELFRNPLLSWLFHGLNAFPVSRGTGDTAAMDTARQIIHSGEVLGIFPEGHRSKDGTLLRIRSGLALLAGQTGADVLPCVIYFDGTLRFRSAVTVRYGKLIPAGDLAVNPQERATLRAASKRVMQEMTVLLEQGV